MKAEDWQTKLDRIRSSSKLSSGYWRIHTNDGRDLLVFLWPPGDLARLRQHYHGAIGEPISRAEWMGESDERATA